MATIRFFIQSKKSPANIYLNFSVSRGEVFRRKSGYVIDPDRWSSATGFPKKNQEGEIKNLKDDLKELADFISAKFNDAVKKKVVIDGEWLQEQIDKHHGKIKPIDEESFLYQIQAYIDYLPLKKLNNGRTGATEGTIQKQRALKVKIENYQKFSGKKFKVPDISPKWVENFEKYLFEVDKLNPNTIGRYIRHVKTVCKYAGYNDIVTHSKLNEVKSYKVKRDVIYLSFDELELIEEKSFDREALNNAKDWLIIGSYSGQRISDLLNLTNKNLTTIAGIEMISLKQQKTGKQVMIPVHEKVKAILEKNGGKFPKKIADQKFNKYIKDVCKEAGINEPTYGGKMVKDEETGITRKQFGVFPKHELASSHICRRSFASNFYGDIPTSLLKDITAHSTEVQLLEYIGRPSTDSAIQVAEYWSKQAANKKKETKMTLVKKAN